MKWIKGYQLYKESKTYSNKNLITEICVSMVLLNNEFLDNILDRGLKARYSENSQIFLTDLKNLLLAKNRLQFGKFIDDKCVADDEVSKINGIFDDVKFDIEKDWNMLVNSRNMARNIIDKLLADTKLDSETISMIYWLGPNKDTDYNEDIVIETNDGKQYSIYLNKNLSSQKTSSFNTFAEDLIGLDIERLFSEDYMPRWDKLAQEWVRIIYEGAHKPVQRHIEKFIDPKRIDTLGYFELFDIKHSDPKYRNLGEFIQEVDKNILKFSDLLTEIWKNKETCIVDLGRVQKEWSEVKTILLNSKIIENLLTSSLKTQFAEDIVKVDDNLKLAGGVVKMKLFKLLVEKMGCLERPVYYLANNGNSLYHIPSREYFRENYDNLEIKFDYHVNFESIDVEDDSFKMKMFLTLNEENLVEFYVNVGFSGGEMSGRLNSKYKFELAPNFNLLVSKKD